MQFTLPLGGSGLAVLVLVLLLGSSIDLAASQAVDRDSIDFSTMEEWKHLKECVQCILQTCENNVAAMLACSTNACLCQGSTLDIVSPKVSVMAVDLCNNPEDASTALNILMAYWFYKGRSEILPSSTGPDPTTSFSLPSMRPMPEPSTVASSTSTSSEPPSTKTSGTSTGTAPGTTSDRGESGQGLNWAEIVGIVVGITGVIVGAVAAYYTWKVVQESRARRQLESSGTQPPTVTTGPTPAASNGANT
jgi:hypothetical protein